MRPQGRFWGGGSVWWSHFLTAFALYPFIMCGGYPISEGCILLATLSWVTGEKMLTASCVNISYVFMTPPGDWSPAVERGSWEIRTLVSDLPGSILYSPLRWEFTLCSILSFVYCWQSSDLSLDMERKFWEFFFLFWQRLTVRTMILLCTQTKPNLTVNMEQGFCYSRWSLPFLWGAETL